MSSVSQYYIIDFKKPSYSCGFDLKDEGKPYKKYAVVSRITDNNASASGLKVGDKVVSVNGEKVSGKDYISLKNNMRTSADNYIRLEILKETDFQLMSPEPVSLQSKVSPLKLSLGRTLIPTGCIKEKIQLFQNPTKNISKKPPSRLSNSCDCINKCGAYSPNKEHNVPTNLRQVSSISADNVMKTVEMTEPEKEKDLNPTISQEPFIDDSFALPHSIVQIHLPSRNIRVIDTKSTEHIKSPISIASSDVVFELKSEPFEDEPFEIPTIHKLEMPEFPNSYSAHSGLSQLSPEYVVIKSHSSHNLFEDPTLGWSLKSINDKSCNEFGSMTNINCETKGNFFGGNKLPRQPSLITNIPIRLRIIQFHDKKSKGWKDYIIEPENNGARFRKRCLENLKCDRMGNFIIRITDVNKFEIDSPTKRHKTLSGNDYFDQESLQKYTLMAFNNRIHLKFHFNPIIFQDDQSSSRAKSTFKEIISSFKAAENKLSHSINPHSLSQSSNINLASYDTQRSVTSVKELNSSIEEFNSVDRQISASNSYKSVSKSSAENLSATTLEMSQSSTRSYFKQAIDKIKPEKKIRITHTYQVFTGTKAEYDEFQKQLEGGHLPLELDSIDENGIHFNRHIYEVPRMNSDPKIPMIIYLCTEIVEKIGLKVEGIYRISGNQRVIRKLTTTLNKPLDDMDANLPEWNNVHAVCGTLKLFLRKLKEYLIPADLSHVLAYSCKGVDCDNPQSLSKTLMDIRYHLSSYQVPSRRRSDSSILDQVDCRWQSLQYVLKHLSKIIAHRLHNNMDEHSVSVCFNPVIMQSWQNSINDIKADNEIMVKALELILIHQEWLFENWNSEKDHSWSSELVENALKYATDFINKKYDFNTKEDYENEFVQNNDIDINVMVKQIISDSTMKFGEKKKLERRHSSHTPGQRPVILRDEIDNSGHCGLRRNSQTTEALDLYTCANWMKEFAKVPTIDETKEIKMTYIPSTDPNCDIYEPCIPDGRILKRQKPLTRLSEDYSFLEKNVVIHSSQKSIDSDLSDQNKL